MDEFKGHVILIERYNHSEVLLGFIRILLHLRFKVSVIAAKRIHQMLDETDISRCYSEIVAEEAEELNAYTSYFNTADFIIFTTIESEFAPFTMPNVGIPKFAVLHSADFYFRKELFGGICSVKGFLKRLELLVKGQYLQRHRWMSQMDGFIFGHDIVTAHVKKKYPEWQHKKMITFPFSIYLDKHSVKLPSNVVKIVIPGTINPRSRNYAHVYKALTKLKNESEIPIVEIVFLGKPSGMAGRKWAKRLCKLSNDKFFVKIFSEEISFIDYEGHLASADFLILPLKRKYCYFSSFEYLNETFISGTIYDMVKVAKPALMPACFPLPHSIEALTERYNDADHLYLTLIDWIKNRTYQYKDKTLLCREFSIENLANSIKIDEFMADKR